MCAVRNGHTYELVSRINYNTFVTKETAQAMCKKYNLSFPYKNGYYSCGVRATEYTFPTSKGWYKCDSGGEAKPINAADAYEWPSSVLCEGE